MGSRDHVVATAACAAFIERCAPGRPIHVVSDERAVRAFLSSSELRDLDECTVTFCGAWRQLTVGVSRSLAEWASKDISRGCGVYLAEEAWNISGAVSSGPMARVMEIDATSRYAVEHAADHRRSVLADELVASVLDSYAGVSTGLALTGHGAEYCIQVGSSSWLSTFESVMLGDGVFLPIHKLASVVFLNGCSTLRMGDSCVPQDFSLARSMFRLGSLVIGSFRNLHTAPVFAEVFAEAVMAGEPLGRVVNRLNVTALARGEQHVAFQLLGDAAVHCAPGLAAPTDRCALSACNHGAPPASFERAIKDAAFLDLVQATFARLIPSMVLAGRASEACSRLTRSANRVGGAIRAWNLIELNQEEVNLTLEIVECDSYGYRTSLLVELADFIQRNTWLQSAYAPLTRRMSAVESTCERCGEMSAWTRFQPFASHLLALDREECDRCGTVRERMGEAIAGPKSRVINVKQMCAKIDLIVPPLPPGAAGLIFLHRMPGFEPVAWPAEGGELSIQHDHLGFQGRVTIVAAVIETCLLELQYHTLFVNPIRPGAMSLSNPTGQP